MVASSSSAQKSPTLQELTAEAHKLFAVLMPTGKIQVIIPEAERAQMYQRYLAVCSQLQIAQNQQAEQKANLDKWAGEVEELLPELIPMLPSDMRGTVEGIMSMGPGKERDEALRRAFNAVIQGGALSRLGAVGVAAGPMIRKFLRTKKL